VAKSAMGEPIVTSWNGNTSTSPRSTARSRDRMKSAMHKNRPRCWRGKVNR
jgi:hypothetical protein